MTGAQEFNESTKLVVDPRLFMGTDRTLWYTIISINIAKKNPTQHQGGNDRYKKIWDLRFSTQWIWRFQFSGMWHHIVW
jgi:hypothetical protein